jgi:hypothetical protein
MVKITRVPLTPLEAMFTAGPIAYTPGSTKRLTPREPAPQMDAAIAACQQRAKGGLGATHFTTAQIVAAQYGLDEVTLYGAWRLASAIEPDEPSN